MKPSDPNFADQSRGRLWRTREELASPAEYQRQALDEFAPSVTELMGERHDLPEDGVSRRNFLKVIGASAALAGMAASPGCKRKTDETIVPYVSQPAEIIPGKPLYFATAMTLGGYAQGIIAQSREGRPIKLEGNPDHPASLGASDVFMQAALLDLYDPDRAQVVTRASSYSDWDTLIGEIRPRLAQKEKSGAGLAILTETITSPTMIDYIAAMKKKYPGARWYAHDPIGRDNVRAGLRQASGREILPRYDFSKARVVLSLDCNFLEEEPGHLRYARDFIDGRRIRAGTNAMNRLYVIESTHTITGAMADHRRAMRPSQIAVAASQIADAVANRAAPTAPDWIAAVATDLLANRGQSIVLAGAHQPPAVHAIVHGINQALGNLDATVHYAAPVEADPDAHLAELAADMDAGTIDFLLIFGGNPVYTAPADLQFDARLEAFSRQPSPAGGLRNFTAHLGLYEDETSFKCQWHLPQTHFLEEWNDARAYDGTVSITQPLIEPLYTGRSTIEVMHTLLETTLVRGYDILRAFWLRQNSASDADAAWARALQRGTMTETGKFQPAPPNAPPSRAGAANPTTAAREASAPTAPLPPGTFELSLRPDPCVYDGTFANNAWLQELPKPLTKLTWDNAAHISPASAARLGAKDGDLLKITTAAGTLDVPALILPGQPDDSLTLHLGYGRTRAGSVGTGVGFNAYTLRHSDNLWLTTAKISRTDQTHILAVTHSHQTIAERHLGGVYPIDAEVVAHPNEQRLDNRKLIRVASLQQFMDDPDFARKADEAAGHSLTLYPGYDNVYKQNLAWGMSIDTQSCIGCNACVIACQAENNIPVVGKDQVTRGREMHWIRIDTYFEGDAQSPAGAYHQPIPCMHCENAPCELVCPVGATVHDNEGINDMVYNRCVGTRYCSNNCPYKVRRFNFLSYTDYTTESLKLARNPQVTVRSRGVMEKCTYCIQRVTATRIEMEKLQLQLEEQAQTAPPQEAEALKRKSAQLRQQILDNLQTACQQACPTRAIVFGNINPAVDPIHELQPDHVSDVKALKAQPHDYSLLEDLTTRPRTTYLARVRNPNPALAATEVRPA